IRRAVELATDRADAGDAIPEEEVVRIAGEVGLSPQYVRQALFELPALQRLEKPTLAARYIGPAVVSATRTVPGDADTIVRRLEQYLTTREYLQTRRHQPGQLALVPADDALSKVFRAMTRTGRRFQLARATRVGVAAEPVDDVRARVRLDIDLEERRHDAFVGGGVLGTFFGVLGGNALGFGAGAAAVALHAATALVIASGVGFGLVGLVGGVWGGLKIMRHDFHRRVGDAHAEADALLDRLQAGERLEPPPSPLLRRLRDRFVGSIPLR
ncbi:MAG TPA: hypothetical protein VFQ39_06595, partial [Longimicrobium sp.]|nr:hypothetical protein [Longimicrobium sp.]